MRLNPNLPLEECMKMKKLNPSTDNANGEVLKYDA